MGDVYEGRNAEILESIIDASGYEEEPQSRIEELLLELKDVINGKLPEAPEEDGTYTLKCVVSSGKATYSWEE